METEKEKVKGRLRKENMAEGERSFSVQINNGVVQKRMLCQRKREKAVIISKKKSR